MNRHQLGPADRAGARWAAAVVAPERDWAGAPGCRRGARFLVDGHSLRASRDSFEAFADRLDCLEWIMAHRAALARTLPGARVAPVRLDRWLLGLD